MGMQSKKAGTQFWDLQEFLKPDGSVLTPTPYLTNIIGIAELYGAAKEACREAGKHVNPPCTSRNPTRPYSTSGCGDSDEDVLAVRDWFPKVWFFDDYKLSASDQLNLSLWATYTVTEWRLTSNCWTPGRSGACMVANVPSVKTLRSVFMDVDLPSPSISTRLSPSK